MKSAFIVLKKEIREMIKDRKVIRTVFLMPFLSMFVMTQFLGFIVGSVKDQVKNAELCVITHGQPISLIEGMKKGGAKVKEVTSVDAGKELIQKGETQLVLEFPADFDTQLQQSSAHITTYFDGSHESSQIAMRAVEEAINKANKEATKQVLKASNLSENILEPIKIDKKDVAKKKSSDLLMQLLPYLMILLSFVSGMAFAADLVAGEKERMTLETLLLTPTQRKQIVLGKYMSLALICILAAVNTFIAINLFGRAGKAAEIIFPNGSGFDAMSIFAILLAMIPLALFFAGLLLATSSYAKNMRECQGYLGFISTFVTMPAVFSQVIGITGMSQSTWIKFVPVLNTSLVIRQGFQGAIDPLTLLGAAGTSLILALIGYLFAVKMFQSEKVLNRI